MDEFKDLHFEYFLNIHEKRVNRFFGYVLWICCLVGPAIALGVLLGAFPDVTLQSCLQTLLIALAFAVGHTILCKKLPDSPVIKYIGLLGTLCTIYTMCVDHIGIYLSYFFVPMTSLLYCRRRTFLTMCGASYLVLLLCNWQISDYMAGLRTDIDAVPWFIGIVGGETIEFLVMMMSGLFINKVTQEYLHTMYSNELTINKKDIELYTDALTGLWNRNYMEKAFDKYIVVQKNLGAMMVVDLDFFKKINDDYGHLEGDKILKLLCGTLKDTFFSDNIAICRFGGDEFVILLPNVQSFSELSLSISKLFSKADELFMSDPKYNILSLSVGAAFVKEHEVNFEKVFDRADKALLQVKRSGRNAFQIYTEEEEPSADAT